MDDLKDFLSGEETTTNVQVDILSDQIDNFILSNESTIQQEPVALLDAPSTKNPFDLINTDNFADSNPLITEASSANLIEGNETASNVTSVQDPIKPSPFEVEAQNETVPDALQHTADSGFYYTNSISEFSTSFPSENKIQDNFCSTPMGNDPQDNLTSESGFTNHQSALSQHVDNKDEDSVPPTREDGTPNPQFVLNEAVREWEASLDNNSTIVDNSAQPKETSDNAPNIIAEQLSDLPVHSENITDNPFAESVNYSEKDLFSHENTNLQSDMNNPFSSNTIQDDDPFSFDNNNKTTEPLSNEAIFAPQFSSDFENISAISQPQEKVDTQIETKIDSTTLVDLNNANNLFDENFDPIKVESEKVPLSEPLNKIEVAQFVQEVVSLEPAQNEQMPIVETPSTTTVETTEVVSSSTDKIEPEQPITKPPSTSKPKIPAVPATKKPLAATSITKTKIATTSKVTITIPKPSPSKPTTSGTVKTVPKPGSASNLRTAALASKVPSKPATQKPLSTIPRSTVPSTAALKPKITAPSAAAATKANGIGSRITSSNKPTTSTTTASKTTLSARTTTTVPRIPITKPSVPKTSTIRPTATASSSNLKAKPTEVKPAPLRKSLPSATKPTPTTGAPKPAVSTLTRPNVAARSTTTSAPASRPRVAPSTSSQPSKVSTLRPATATSKPIAKSGVSSFKPATTKPVNGTPSPSGVKVPVKKPATSTTPKTIDPKANANELAKPSSASVKSPFSTKRPIGVENSLKQELEAAAMNGLNGGLHPVANPEESNTGVNGHSEVL